ncbi:ABC transporter permease [Pseudomaricurvus alcaniphilus]|uniref:ABC transporter permease n=1 Tax=Pseudomaricurvus alcaniphilus TaxID=1166482 RepID=UPI00140A6D08|nr:ABC transporter permease [Pseudomaricurvus alcaniphilus]NHN37989.1 ABC transporter permease [Pseudomaricurvus alcaniphilus]
MATTSIINKLSNNYPVAEKVKGVFTELTRLVVVPLIGLLVFLLLWAAAAQNIDTSLGKFPGPAAVLEQFGSLYDEHRRERVKEEAFYERQHQRNADRVAKDPGYQPKIRAYTGKETFLDQIGTSLVTVMSGFLLAAAVAIPLGIAIGLSKTLNSAVNPIIQVFKPVSPLAWLPLVTMVVSALYVSDDPMVSKAYLVSMITVTLCCLWPMVINTSVGVASIDSDLVNVSKVLRLRALTHVRKIVLPASVPMIFTGMRLSLGIAWMVLIAAEMLAQNPGLGKFVWDEFQNGSSNSLARIMAAILVIGFIGFLLDRGMLQIQRLVSWDKTSADR